MGIFFRIKNSACRAPWMWAAVVPLIFSGCVAPMSPSEISIPACRPVPLRERRAITETSGELASSPEIPLVAEEFSPALAGSMTAEQVRCQAANSATLARLMEMERGLACELHQGDRCLTPNQKALEQELLWLRTRQQGNQAASTALEIFFRLAEAQQQSVNLTARRDEIQANQADLKELKSRELPVDREPAELDRTLLSLQESQTSLEAGLAQGWAQLQVLLDATGPQEIPGMLVATGIPSGPPELEEAVSVAWQSHPELRSLQIMIHRLTPETLPLARALLQQYEGGLGTVQAAGFGVQAQQLLKVFCIFRPNRCPLPSQTREWEVRKIQLVELLNQREKAVAAEVETALIAWKTAHRQWQSAQERLQSWRTQLEELTQKQPVDESVTAFDLAEARLGILEANSDCIKFAFELRQAQVQLWTAQGVTSAGCGLPGDETGPGSPTRWLESDLPGQAGPKIDLLFPARTAPQQEIRIQSCRPLLRRN